MKRTTLLTMVVTCAWLVGCTIQLPADDKDADESAGGESGFAGSGGDWGTPADDGGLAGYGGDWGCGGSPADDGGVAGYGGEWPDGG